MARAACLYELLARRVPAADSSSTRVTETRETYDDQGIWWHGDARHLEESSVISRNDSETYDDSGLAPVGIPASLAPGAAEHIITQVTRFNRETYDDSGSIELGIGLG
jgi:hypothetical protein